MVKRFLTAVQFLTKIPVSMTLEEEDFAPQRMASTMVLFPLVGLLLGSLLIFFDLLVKDLGPLLRNTLLLSFYILLTGGLHLDGLLDSLDGLLPAVEEKRRQEIMKDSNIGAFGAIGLVLSLILNIALLIELPEEVRLYALLSVPVLTRWSMTIAASLFTSRRQEGLAYLFSHSFTRKKSLVSTLLTLSILLIVHPFTLLLLVSLFISTYLLGRWIERRISGLTGDSYGFIHEINQIIALLLIIIGWGLLYGC